jgi:hypothetical protein
MIRVFRTGHRVHLAHQPLCERHVRDQRQRRAVGRRGVRRLERTLRVAPIEPAAVTLSARGESARVPSGETAEVGGLAVQVVSIAGRDVQLTVRPA